jgi:arsenate reductase (thioredoxin)
MHKIKVLFVCIHNSARSQMAEAWLNHLYGEHFAASSAGLEPGTLNPLAVHVMREAGIDLSYRSGQIFSYVITVCDQEAAERCPIFPGVTQRLHWSFPDPAAATGSDAEKLEQTRTIRDALRAQIEGWAAAVQQEKPLVRGPL